MLLTDADQLRKALAIAMRERDELHAFSKELESNVRRLARERDEARAEVERLERLFQQTHGVHHSWVDARHKVAERQREACAKQFEGEGASVSDRGNAKWVRATPLVTEVEP